MLAKSKGALARGAPGLTTDPAPLFLGRSNLLWYWLRRRRSAASRAGVLDWSKKMVVLTDRERQLLERLANAGKATSLVGDDLELANALEADGFVFLVRDSSGRAAAHAVITPKGRRALAGPEPATKPAKKPLGFLD
jgi:hypothetical protein